VTQFKGNFKLIQYIYYDDYQRVGSKGAEVVIDLAQQVTGTVYF
jgi:hypothetical protein